MRQWELQIAKNKQFPEPWLNCGSVDLAAQSNLYSDKRTNLISEIFQEVCRNLGIERISTTSFQLEGNALPGRKTKHWNKTSRSTWITINLSGKSLPSASIDGLPLFGPHSEGITSILRFSVKPLRLPFDCLNETRHFEFLSTATGLIFNTTRKMQKAHHLVRADLEVEWTCHLIFYNYRAYGPT